MTKITSAIINFTKEYHPKLMDRKVNREESWRNDEFSEGIRKKIHETYGKQEFKIWKEYLKSLITELNNTIKPTWKYDSDFYIRDDKEKWKTELNPLIKDKILNLEYSKLIFDVIFPNSKIYIVWFGNLIRDTRYFKRGQKIRYYQWGHNTFEWRGGWLGFNRHTRKYEVHNFYHKYIDNIRFKLVGHVDVYDSFTYF